MSDAELVEASRQQPERFDELVRRHHGAILRFAARRVGADAAPDVAQETFARAFAGRRRFRPLTEGCRRRPLTAKPSDRGLPQAGPQVASSAAPWLYGIAVNVLREHGRRERRHFETLARMTGQETSYTPTLGGPEVSSELLVAVRALPRRDREALLLLAWAELSPDEIAVALDIPPGTVRSRLHRARRRLAAIPTIAREAA